ncbi:MAG: zinc-binding dehydrogenase [Armatimonadetes bacterium]|nr:zinc-binding dehydrogenase [Armatimonadota bacterium]
MEHAIVITAREQAELREVARPAAPLGPNEVAGRTLATLVSTGTELAACYLAPDFPREPGYAAVFEVEAVGSEVRSLRVGDRAFCMGPHRSFQQVPAEAAVPLPAGLAPEVAVFCRLMGVTMSTLTTTTARPPELVLVTGLGPVGHLGARIFANCGYQVVACDPVESRREVARQAGIHPVLPAVPLEDPAIAGQVGLVLECSGHEAAVLDGCRVVRRRGEVVLVGVPWQQQTTLSAHALLDAVFHRYAVLRSGWEWELPLHPQEFRVNSIYGSFAAALRWLAEGRITVDGLYRTAAPQEAQSVYQDLLHRRWTHLAAVFTWS